MKNAKFASYTMAFSIVFAGVPAQATRLAEATAKRGSLYALGTVHTGLIAEADVSVGIANSIQANTDVDASVNAEVNGDMSTEGEISTSESAGAEGSVEVEAQSEGAIEAELGGWDSEEKKEVVVTRSTVDMAVLGYAEAEVDVNEVRTSADLEAVAHAVVAEDENISEVALKPWETNVSYAVSGKFLGIVPVTLTAQITLDQEGNVKIKYPWYGAFVKKQVDLDAVELENKVKAALVVTPGGETFAAQASGLQALGNMLKVTHDISFAASVAE